MKDNNRGNAYENIIITLLIIVVISLVWVVIVCSFDADYYGLPENATLINGAGIYYDNSDFYVYCSVTTDDGKFATYQLYTEDGNKVKFINGRLVEDETGKVVKINESRKY